ncbi:MAG: hypothetical protein KKA35_03140, partial [Proteobacteria bacterium]|nr:hypothetical protein [Pseudomonadota bacterium]
LRDSGPDEIATYLSSFLGTSYELIAPYIDTKDSNIYTIEAKGYMKEKKINYAIRSTVIIERNNKYRVVYYKSPV